jgi:hypothetical protein
LPKIGAAAAPLETAADPLFVIKNAQAMRQSDFYAKKGCPVALA